MTLRCVATDNALRFRSGVVQTILTATLVLLFSTLGAHSQDSDSEKLRALLKSTPDLALQATDVRMPAGLTLVGISSVAADKQGNLYVIHRPESGDPIVELDPTGKFIRSWGHGLFKIPHSIRIDAAGNVWAMDANTSMIYKFTPEGKKLLEISVGGIPNASAAFCGATDIAFAENGHLFVTDGYCNARILEYDASGKKLNEWGSPGSGPGEFKLIHSIAIGPQGNLYVADRENGRIQWFDQKGLFLGQWKYGGQLHSLAFNKSGDLYAVLHPKGAPPEKESYLVKIDHSNGLLLGKYPVRSHELGIADDGTLLPATRSEELLLLKPER
jgi:DNA-binding beta-propeller fold protein YncE